MDIYLSRRGQTGTPDLATGAHERCPAVSPDGARLAYLKGPTIVIAPLDAEGSPGAPAVRVDLKAQGLYRPDEYRPGRPRAARALSGLRTGAGWVTWW
jgi:hypothetical protein